MLIESRLKDLGIELPTPMAPVANYVPWVKSGNLIHISGQISKDATGGILGTVGVDISLEEGQKAARICGINLLAQLKSAVGDLSAVKRVVKLGVFVQAGPDFFDIPQVANGCSNLMVEVLGDAGKHARSAVGVYRLPLNVAVEVDGIFEV
jgi:enamine deaminase RidA (YjgF/YER057c/UK114 family)